MNITGTWTGEIKGTNSGTFYAEIKQEGTRIIGIARINEPSLGIYDYSINGTTGASTGLILKPQHNPNKINLGIVTLIPDSVSDHKINGKWSSTNGMTGIFYMNKELQNATTSTLPSDNSVFIVHGHDEGTKQTIARFVENIGLKPVILNEQINRGLTLIEKFEDFAARAGFAIILITPDDYGYPKGRDKEIKPRARQNVIFELGYFVAKLGRDRTAVLCCKDVESPSDLAGLVYTEIDSNSGWKMTLAKELKAAGFTIDLNNALQ